MTAFAALSVSVPDPAAGVTDICLPFSRSRSPLRATSAAVRRTKMVEMDRRNHGRGVCVTASQNKAKADKEITEERHRCSTPPDMAIRWGAQQAR